MTRQVIIDYWMDKTKGQVSTFHRRQFMGYVRHRQAANRQKKTSRPGTDFAGVIINLDYVKDVLHPEMEAALKKSFELLKEHRSDLITAAVMGQLNISGEAA